MINRNQITKLDGTDGSWPVWKSQVTTLLENERVFEHVMRDIPNDHTISWLTKRNKAMAILYSTITDDMLDRVTICTIPSQIWATFHYMYKHVEPVPHYILNNYIWRGSTWTKEMLDKVLDKKSSGLPVTTITTNDSGVSKQVLSSDASIQEKIKAIEKQIQELKMEINMQ